MRLALLFLLVASAAASVFVNCGPKEKAPKGVLLVGDSRPVSAPRRSSLKRAYRTARVANGSDASWGYDVNLKPGFYELALHFAEFHFSAAGKRRFGVKLQGRLYERAFDPYAAAGNSSMPVVEKYVVEVTGKTLAFRLLEVDGLPMLSAFAVTAAPEQIMTPFRVNVGGKFGGYDGFYDEPVQYLKEKSKAYSKFVWDLPNVYFSGREGPVVYQVPVANGSKYDVTLHFAEADLSYRFVGARVFTLLVNGAYVKNFDVFKIGGNRPVSYTFKSVVPKDGYINIRLLGQAGPPMLSAFAIEDEGSKNPSGLSAVVFAMNLGGAGNSGFVADNATLISDVKDKRTARAKWVTRTSMPEVFRTQRTSSTGIGVSIPVDPVVKETYHVDLLFTENEHHKTGRRVMDIRINGRNRKSVDLFYEFGSGTAVTLSFDRIVPSENGTIDVEVFATKGKATLSGFLVRKDYNDGPAPGWVPFPVKDKSAMLVRHEHCAVQYDGAFYLIGGRRRMYNSKFVPADGVWSYAAMPPIEVHHMQCAVVEDRVFVGMAFTGEYPREQLIDRVLWYHPKNDSWTWGATIPPKRNRGCATVVARNGTIYIANGNIGGHGAHSTSLNWFDAYDVKKDKWHVLPDTPVARDHGMATIVGSKIVISGGRNGGVANFFNATENQIDVWDFENPGWVTAAQVLDQPSSGALIGSMGKKYAVVAGGEGFAGIWGRTLFFDVELMRLIDLGQGSMVTPRHGTQLINCRNALYAISGSGWQGGGPELDSIEALTMDGRKPALCT